jgi:class 3 adenylate cyclase
VTEAKADAPQHKKRRQRVMRLSMATRLAAAVVVVSFVALTVATVVGLRTGESLGKDIYEERLTGLQSTGATNVAAELNSTKRMATSLSASPQAVVALDEFSAALDTLDGLSESELEIDVDRLIEDYEERFIVPLQDRGRDIEIPDIVGDNSVPLYLQYNYAVDIGVLDDPELVDDADDGTRWSEVHDIVHPVYRDVAEELELLDIYLIDPDDLRVVYSVAKGPDLATSLKVGPFGGSALANTVKRVAKDPSAGAAASDISFYSGVPDTPVGVVASPVMDGDRLAGVLALMYDGLVYTDILTADGEWEDAGYSESSDTYMVGDDATTRSDPRLFVEEPQVYLDESQEAGLLSDSERAAIEAARTTVLTQRVIDATFTAGEDGDEDVAIRSSLTGIDVASIVAPVLVDDVTWFVVAEVEIEAARQEVSDFRNVLIVGVAIFIVIIAFFAVGWANRIMSPVRAISERLGSAGRSKDAPLVDERSPVELQNLASSFESMTTTLDQQQVQLAIAREERLQAMRKMLPTAVAERIAAGDLQAVDEVPNVTVVVLVVLGLGDLVRSDANGADRETVDRLHAELDELALQHGLDRVKVVGDAYFAACGHDRQYIDHAPRAIAFAADAHDVIRELSVDSPADLDVAVGIHTGSVTVGMTGGARLVYDVWGATVTSAHHLARRAGRGEVLVSGPTKDLLPESIEAEPYSRQSDDEVMWSINTLSVGGPP